MIGGGLNDGSRRVVLWIKLLDDEEPQQYELYLAVPIIICYELYYA